MCVASGKCKNCDADVSDIATVTYAVKKAPTCLNAGTGTYTATFSAAYGFPAQTKDVLLPAIGHTWGTATYTWTQTGTGYTCTAKRVCENDPAHVESETVTGDYSVITEPTCLAAGLGRYQVSFKAEWAKDASKDVSIPALGHDWGKWTSNGDGTHTRKCTVDGCAGSETKDCSGGKATCKDKAKCEICGAEYGELDPKNHPNLKHFPATAATKTAEGNIEYWYCGGCDKYYSDKDGISEIKKADTVTAKLPGNPKSPRTGNASDLALWISLLFVSGGVTGVTAGLRKKKKHKV